MAATSGRPFGVVPQVVRLRAGEISIAGVSPEHPFWDAAARAFRPVAALSLESRVAVLLPGARTPRELAVEEIAIVPGPPVEVWNLEVDGEEHTYFAEGILVHNKSCGGDASGCGDDSSGVGGSGGAGGSGDAGAASGTGGTGGAGVEAQCEPILGEPELEETITIVITNTSDVSVEVFAADSCASMGQVDGLYAVPAGQRGNCEDVIAGMASQGDCIPTVEVLDPGAQTLRNWAGRVVEIVEVPVGCDGAAEQIAFPQCTRAVVVDPGTHTFTIDVDPGSDVARNAEVLFDYPASIIRMTSSEVRRPRHGRYQRRGQGDEHTSPGPTRGPIPPPPSPITSAPMAPVVVAPIAAPSPALEPVVTLKWRGPDELPARVTPASTWRPPPMAAGASRPRPPGPHVGVNVPRSDLRGSMTSYRGSKVAVGDVHPDMARPRKHRGERGCRRACRRYRLRRGHGPGGLRGVTR